jgi:ABC-type multidrug transport system permease subunit
VTSILYFAFVFLFASSMFCPIDPLPAWLRIAAMLNPVTWRVDVLRFATVGIGEPVTLAWQALAFTMFSTASFVAATRSLERPARARHVGSGRRRCPSCT